MFEVFFIQLKDFLEFLFQGPEEVLNEMIITLY